MTDVRCDENVLNLTVLGIFIRCMYVNAHLMSLILGGHAHESIIMASNCVINFHFPSVCVLMSISAAYVTIGSYISRVSTNYTFAIVDKGRYTENMSVIGEPGHVAVRLQLLEMSSITTPNQTISNVCTRYNILRALLKNIGDFYRYATMKRFSTVIAC